MVAVVFLGVGIVSVLVLMKNPRQDIEWLAKSPIQQRPQFLSGRWTQPVRIQLSRLKQWMFGPKQTIAVNAMILELSPAAASELASNATGFTNTAGARAFVIQNGARVREELLATASAGKPAYNVMSSPRIITAEGVQAQFAITHNVFIGSPSRIQQANAGWWIDVWPRTSGRAIDLTCFLTQTERALQRVSPPNAEVTNIAFLRTNVSLGARVRVPENGSLFLLSPSTNTNGFATGILLSPTVQKRPGR